MEFTGKLFYKIMLDKLLYLCYDYYIMNERRIKNGKC